MPKALAAHLSRLIVASGALAVVGGAQAPEFNRDVRPILSDNCFACHGPDAGRRKAGLRLDQQGDAFADRRGGPAIAPGDPAGSAVWRRITEGDPEERMPPPEAHKELSRQQVETIRRWIDAGAEYQAPWSLVPPQRAQPPRVEDEAWCRGPIDRWVLSRLEREGLSPSPQADPRTLVRRLHFDLIGLPPSPEQAEAFIADAATDRYEQLVDRLLASPHFGERMAMYWLDLVRYADTVGYHGDQEHPIAPYRDWVIRAFNANMPFDRFTVAQIAGDLLPEPSTDDLVATGYNRVLQTTHEGGAQAKEYLAIYAADRVRNLASVWMGATLGCAQCHDHKFDPYTTRDFYAMQAFFADVQEKGDFAGSPNRTPTTRPPEMVLHTPEQQAVIARLQAEFDAGDEEARKRLGPVVRAARDRGRRTMITVSAAPRETRVLPRGDWLDDSGEVVQPAVPAVMQGPDAEGARRATRLDLARWLTTRDHPQTARVMVNRLWYLFFGRGLSGRLDDLGAQGEWPSHPELLDELAVEFASDWDVKRLIRLIVTSSAYRQSSLVDAALAERDPDNRLVARQSRWRVPAEMVRDAALSISGLLQREVGGDSVKPYQPAGYYRHLNFPRRKYKQHDDDRQWRRGVYVHWQRMFLHPALLAFDAPTREECSAERAVSNTPQAALTLLNDPTFVEAARVFAARVLRETSGDDDARLRAAFRQAVSRAPAELELAPVRALLTSHRQYFADHPEAARALVTVGLSPPASGLSEPELAAWTSVARVLLNLNETITRN